MHVREQEERPTQNLPCLPFLTSTCPSTYLEVRWVAHSSFLRRRVLTMSETVVWTQFRIEVNGRYVEIRLLNVKSLKSNFILYVEL